MRERLTHRSRQTRRLDQPFERRLVGGPDMVAVDAGAFEMAEEALTRFRGRYGKNDPQSILGLYVPGEGGKLYQLGNFVPPGTLLGFGTANTGPMPISSGSQPATAKPRNTPSGSRLSFSAREALMTTQADAPSENWLALPAAITPPSTAGSTQGRLKSGKARATHLRHIQIAEDRCRHFAGLCLRLDPVVSLAV